MRTRLGILLLVCAACAEPADARPPELPVPVALTRVAIAPPDAGRARAFDAGPPLATGAIHLAVTETSGVPAGVVDEAYQAAREPLQQCRQSGGGEVNVRITRSEGRFHLSVEPGASLDPSARHCVLEALSTIELEETAGSGSGPEVPPSGFTSLIKVSW